MSTGRIILVIVAVIILFISFGLSIGGGGILVLNGTMTDDDGFLMSDPVSLQKDSHAIITEAAEVDLGSSWAADGGNIVTFKERVESNNRSNIFIGVASEDDLNRYLKNVAHDRITDGDIEDDDWGYERIPGTAKPAPPTTQTFWAHSSHGPGPQVLEWELENGTWVFVVMNEDGSAGIDLDLEIGAKLPWLFGLGIGLLIAGIVGLIVGIIMIVFAVRKPREVNQNNQIFS